MTTKRVPHRFRMEGWTGHATAEERVCWSLFDSGDIDRFLRLGYLLAPGLLDGTFVDELRGGLEDLRRRDFGETREPSTPPESHFQGQYVLDLMFRHPAMARLLSPEPLLDTVRSLLGPCVALYSCSGLVSFPAAARSGTDWHSDYLMTVSPRPPMGSVNPRVVCMVYLDDLTEQMGPTYVIPGSHLWGQVPPWQGAPDLVGEALTPPAGSVLFFDAALWHRGGRMNDPSRPRRSIIFTLVAGGNRLMREFPARPAEGTYARELLDRAEREGDVGMLELMSRQWYG